MYNYINLLKYFRIKFRSVTIFEYYYNIIINYIKINQFLWQIKKSYENCYYYCNILPIYVITIIYFTIVIITNILLLYIYFYNQKIK